MTRRVQNPVDLQLSRVSVLEALDTGDNSSCSSGYGPAEVTGSCVESEILSPRSTLFEGFFREEVLGGSGELVKVLSVDG